MNSTLTSRIFYGLRLTAVAAMVCSSVHVEDASAQSARLTEHQVKAAFVYKFARFVQWPSQTFVDSADTLVIAVLGKDPIAAVLGKVVEGKTVHGRSIRIEAADDLQEVESFHILYISESKRRQLGTILEQLARTPLLTVSDMTSFARDGGIIGFGEREERISLDINLAVAERAGLRVSSRLLKIANIVDGKAGD